MKRTPPARRRAKSRRATEDLLAAADWAARHAEGRAIGGRKIEIQIPDVRAIRTRLRLSQSAFAEKFGLNVRTLQDWEQGRKVPEQTARVLLRVISRTPDAVEQAVAA
ncbi:MAG: helix-turn-helix domain-containing protein [Alphaproteobacteria bacterium]|nr:helix-turn-helix domain-containing protein [Alphaproteobacteria bacterium]